MFEETLELMIVFPTTNIRSSHPERSTFPPRTIDDVMYYVSEGSSHAVGMYDK